MSYLQQSQIMESEALSKKNLEEELWSINKFLQEKLSKQIVPLKENKKMTLVEKLINYIEKEKKES